MPRVRDATPGGSRGGRRRAGPATPAQAGQLVLVAGRQGEIGHAACPCAEEVPDPVRTRGRHEAALGRALGLHPPVVPGRVLGRGPRLRVRGRVDVPLLPAAGRRGVHGGPQVLGDAREQN